MRHSHFILFISFFLKNYFEIKEIVKNNHRFQPFGSLHPQKGINVRRVSICEKKKKIIPCLEPNQLL